MKNAKQGRRLKGHRRKNINHKFLGSPAYQGDDFMPISIKLIQYRSDSIVNVKDVSGAESVKGLIDPDKVNWLRVTGLSDVKRISSLCKEFGLHSFDIRDLLSEQQVTKVVSYRDVTFVLMHGFLPQKDNTLDDITVAYIMGPNFVVSFQENIISSLDNVEEAILENDFQLKERSADYLLYILMSAVNSTIVNSIIKIEDALLETEDQLIAQQDITNVVHYLRSCRLDYTMMKRTMLAMREEFPNLLHNENQLIDKKNIVYFNNYDDKIRTTLSNLDELNELLSSLLDIYYNNNNIKMNEIMKRLTLVSTIFIPLTFLTGVWGMNFQNMPELKFEYGYYFAWIILIAVNIITLILLKKKKWF